MPTDAHFRNLKAGDRDVRLSDGGGLHLFVTVKGHRSWRLKYRSAGREERLIIGVYPEVSLKEARARQDAVKADIRAGRDPKGTAAEPPPASVGGPTFETVAGEWFGRQRKRWKPVHAADAIGSLETDLFPAIGAITIGDVDAPTLLAALCVVEARDAVETIARIRQRAGKVFRYAIASGLIRVDPAVGLGEALEPAALKDKWPALTALDDLRALVAKADVAVSSPLTRLASRFRPAARHGARDALERDWRH